MGVGKSCCSAFIANSNSSSDDSSGTKGEEFIGELKFDVMGVGKNCSSVLIVNPDDSSDTKDVGYCCSASMIISKIFSVDSEEVVVMASNSDDEGVTGE